MTRAPRPIPHCDVCGTEIRTVGESCPTCPTVSLRVVVDATVVVETLDAPCDAGEADCTPPALWARVTVAFVYLVVAAAFGYGSVGFFDGNFTTSSDWVFGAMAIALALVALWGVKETLLPSRWTPE